RFPPRGNHASPWWDRSSSRFWGPVPSSHTGDCAVYRLPGTPCRGGVPAVWGEGGCFWWEPGNRLRGGSQPSKNPGKTLENRLAHTPTPVPTVPALQLLPGRLEPVAACPPSRSQAQQTNRMRGTDQPQASRPFVAL